MSTDFTTTPDGTPAALLPITEKVLAWVATRRASLDATDARLAEVEALGYDVSGARASIQPRREDLRRIELCALATREACFLHDLYPPPPAVGRVVHRDPADDSGFYLPPEDRAVVSGAIAPLLEAAEARSVPYPCVRCGQPTTRYMMATADDRPTYVCDLWPDCQET